MQIAYRNLWMLESMHRIGLLWEDLQLEKKKGIFLAAPDGFRIKYVFADGRREMFEETLDMCPDLIYEGNLEEHKEFLRETEIIVSTWQIPHLSREQISKYLPNAKLLLYCAGSTQGFAREFLACGVRIASAWGAMSIPVAEFTVGEIIHANKGFYRSLAIYKEKDYLDAHWEILQEYPGTYGTKVGILGAGMIGSKVIEMLKNYDVEVMVFDPFLTEEKMKKLGIEKTYSLEEIFSQCQTISNHIANKPETEGIFDYHLFSMMKKNASFINTGRGKQVVEADLMRALEEEPHRCALLDVTWPEPVDRKLQAMPNVFVTPHIAGFANQEVLRMPDCLHQVLLDYLKDGSVQYEVTEKMLEYLA